MILSSDELYFMLSSQYSTMYLYYNNTRSYVKKDYQYAIDNYTNNLNTILNRVYN